jgi:hypothetical protein
VAARTSVPPFAVRGSLKGVRSLSQVAGYSSPNWLVVGVDIVARRAFPTSATELEVRRMEELFSFKTAASSHDGRLVSLTRRQRLQK